MIHLRRDLVLAALNCFSVRAAVLIAWRGSGRVAIAAWTAGDIYYTIFLDGKAVVPSRPSRTPATSSSIRRSTSRLVVLFDKEVRGIVAASGSTASSPRSTTAALAASVVYAIVERSLNGSGETAAGAGDEPRVPARRHARCSGSSSAPSRSPAGASRREWLVFGGGLLVFAGATASISFEIAKNTYTYGTWLDLGWPAGMLLIAGAGTLPSRRVRAAQLDGYRLILVPALFGSVALVLEIVDHFQTPEHARDDAHVARARRRVRAAWG